MSGISQAITRLFERERFYAELVSQMRRVESNKVPLAGVCIKDHIELHINEPAFSKLTTKEQVAVLRHECEHILRDHIPRFKEYEPSIFGSADGISTIVNSLKFKTLNVAADMAINGTMQDLPSFGIFPQKFGLPEGHTFEWYMEKIKNDEKLQKKMGSLVRFDDHSIWAESDKSKEMIKAKIHKAINDAARRTKAAGQLSAEHELLIDQINGSVVNWREQLRRFVARNNETLRESSKKRRNRRYGTAIPGDVKYEKLHLGVAMDTSGSVSDEALKQFISEIHIIAKTAKVTVVEADSEIKNVYEYDPKKKYGIKGRGGTAYKPVFDHFNKKENAVDGLIYFGDMDTFDREALKKPKYPVLWAIVGDQNPPANFGAKLYVGDK